MKNILVIYYTQSGQTKDIIDSILQPLEKSEDVRICYERIKPVQDYPYPWGGKFFDCFPESVKGIPCSLEPFNYKKNIDYDLIVVAYQPWYLSPSIPVWSFLESEEANRLFANKKVITIIGARNMWICSQEIAAGKLLQLKAELVGNIVLTDRLCNYVSVINIIRWLIKGNKKPTMLLPEAGVNTKDIVQASRFGEIISDTFRDGDWEHLQNKLLEKNAVKVKYHLLKMEKNARKIFNKFAIFVLNVEPKNESGRLKRIRLFKIYLLFVIFVVSPLASLIFNIRRLLFFKQTKKIILHYSGVDI